MKIAHCLIPLAALFLGAQANADAFKCKGRDGSTIISSEPCPGDSRTESVRPSEKITPEQKQEAERQLARDRERLAEREKARNAEETRDQETRRRLAEEESARKSRCLDNAQREPDPNVRANLIAACNGVAPPQPTVVQQPVYVPVTPVRRVQQPAVQVCVGNNCNEPRHPQPVTPPANQGSGKPTAPFAPSAPIPKNCHPVGNTLRCD